MFAELLLLLLCSLPASAFESSELLHCAGETAGNSMLAQHGVSTQGVGMPTSQHVLTIACEGSSEGGSPRDGEQTWLVAYGHHGVTNRNPLGPCFLLAPG